MGHILIWSQSQNLTDPVYRSPSTDTKLIIQRWALAFLQRFSGICICMAIQGGTQAANELRNIYVVITYYVCRDNGRFWHTKIKWIPWYKLIRSIFNFHTNSPHLKQKIMNCHTCTHYYYFFFEEIISHRTQAQRVCIKKYRAQWCLHALCAPFLEQKWLIDTKK